MHFSSLSIHHTETQYCQSGVYNIETSWSSSISNLGVIDIVLIHLLLLHAR
jgi:hypothetical protein